jgi:hypothetical protein
MKKTLIFVLVALVFAVQALPVFAAEDNAAVSEPKTITRTAHVVHVRDVYTEPGEAHKRLVDLYFDPFVFKMRAIGPGSFNRYPITKRPCSRATAASSKAC